MGGDQMITNKKTSAAISANSAISGKFFSQNSLNSNRRTVQVDRKPAPCNIPSRCNSSFEDTNRNTGSLTYEEVWLTTKEAAKYLKVTVGAVRNMTSNGHLPYYKLQGRNRYLLIELRDLLLSQKRGDF